MYKEFGVPVVLTAVETESFSGYIWPQVMDIFRELGGAYGDDIEYAFTMVHKAPQAVQNPHVVKK